MKSHLDLEKWKIQLYMHNIWLIRVEEINFVNSHTRLNNWVSHLINLVVDFFIFKEVSLIWIQLLSADTFTMHVLSFCYESNDEFDFFNE